MAQDDKKATRKLYHDITHVHQILISGAATTTLPRKGVIADNIKAVQRLYPGALHRIWGNAEIEMFLEEHFSMNVLYAYKVMTPYAYKADLARYCLLYIYGGMYVDLGICCMNPWNIPLSKGFATFKEISFPSDSWTTMQNGLIWSLPERKELLYCIEMIVQNCRNKFYGKSPLYITGPIMFGRAIARAMVEQGQGAAADDQFIGEYRWTTPEHAIKNDAYIAPDHSLVAFRTKHRAGDLVHLGIKATNNYNAIWRNRKVFGEKGFLFSFRRYGNVFDDRLKTPFERSEEGLDIASTSHDELIAFGPYVTLRQGTYKLHLALSADHEGEVAVGITGDGGKQHFPHTSIEAPPPQIDDGLVYRSFVFTLERDYDLFEIVLKTMGGFTGRVVSYQLEPVDALLEGYARCGQWLPESPEIKTALGKKEGYVLALPAGEAGRVSYGPYIPLDAGEYVLKVQFSEQLPIKPLFVEIAHETGTNLLKLFRFPKGAVSDTLVCPFSLVEPVSDLEFRINTNGHIKGQIVLFELYRK